MMIVIEGHSRPSVGASAGFLSGLPLVEVYSGTGTTAPLTESRVAYIGDWTATTRTFGPTVNDAVTHGADGLTSADQVRWLHEWSGLTWEQLGRMFGVSRRSVHMWASGKRMNASNAEVLGELVALVHRLPSGTADERRASLLSSTADGQSIVDRFRARSRSAADDVGGTPFRPDELLAALHDDVPSGASAT